MCKPFSRIGSACSRITDSFPRFIQLVLSDCNSFSRVPSIYTIQSKRTSYAFKKKIHVHSVLFWYSLLSRHHGFRVNSKTDLDAMRSDWHSDTYGIIQYIEIWCNQNYLGFSNENENIVNKNFKKNEFISMVPFFIGCC